MGVDIAAILSQHVGRPGRLSHQRLHQLAQLHQVSLDILGDRVEINGADGRIVEFLVTVRGYVEDPVGFQLHWVSGATSDAGSTGDALVTGQQDQPEDVAEWCSLDLPHAAGSARAFAGSLVTGQQGQPEAVAEWCSLDLPHPAPPPAVSGSSACPACGCSSSCQTCGHAMGDAVVLFPHLCPTCRCGGFCQYCGTAVVPVAPRQLGGPLLTPTAQSQ